MLTRKELRKLFSYNASTGLLTWRVTKLPNGVKGERAGALTKEGYRVYINGKTYLGKRIIWCWVHDEWVDRITYLDGDNTNHRLKNLCPLP